MTPEFDPYALRLAQLQRQIETTSALVETVENRLSVEPGPLEREKLRQDAQHVRGEFNRLLAEYDQLQAIQAGSSAAQSEVRAELHAISTKLEMVDSKLDDMRAVIIAKFSGWETSVIETIVSRLKDQQQAETKAVLDRLDTIALSDTTSGEIEDLLVAVRVVLESIPAISGGDSALREETRDKLGEFLGDSKIEVKHRLKMSIPLIPFLLSYEGEWALNAAENVKKSVEKLKSDWGLLLKKKPQDSQDRSPGNNPARP